MGGTPIVRPHESTLGQGYVGLGGVIVITLYLVFTSLADFYLLVKIWPPDPLPLPVISSTVNPPADQKADVGQVVTQDNKQTAPIKWPVSFIWCESDNRGEGCWISLSTSLFLIAILAGALGSLLHSLRSLYWYAGNRKLVWSWAVMYMLLPFSGGVIAMIFYIIIRAGFLPSSGGTTATIPSTPYGFAAMGALVGLFSEEAVLKLKQVAETVFAKAPSGKDHAGPPPKVASISPNSGPAAGGTEVTITGVDFAPGAKVNLGGTAVSAITSVSTTSISATTPAHAAGQADVEVVNPDGQKGSLTGGFNYV